MFMMPSMIRLLKAIIWSFLAFIAICFVFVTLPSPKVPEYKVTSALQNGRTVMRAYKLGSFLPHTAFPLEIRRGFDGVFVIQWSFSPDAQTLRVNEQHDILLRADASPRYFTSFNVTVITNVRDGVMLPYFNMADAVLLNNVITPHAAVLPLRITRRSTSATTTIYDIAGEPPMDVSHLRQLLTITYDSTPSTPTFDFPPEPYSVSPSTTFPIRRVIVGALVPVAFVVMFASAAAYVLIKMFLVGVMLVGIWVLLFGPLKFWNINKTVVATGEPHALEEAGTKVSDVDESNAEAAKIDSKSADDVV